MSNRRPRLSMGLPVYNGAQYLGESLDGLLTQDMADFEIIISDNASTDNTFEIAQDYARRDPRIRVVRQPVNMGAAGNFNYVFRQARGTYFRWVCADDRTAPGFLGKAIAELDAHPEAVLCYGGITLIDGQGRVTGTYDQALDLRSADPAQRFAAARAHRGLMNLLQAVMRPEAVRKTRLIGSFPASDEAFIVELCLHGKFHAIPHPMMDRRMHAQAASAGQTLEERQEHLNPGTVGKVYLEGWRRAFEDLHSALRAPISMAARKRAFGVVLRTARKDWRSMRWEVTYALRVKLARLRQRMHLGGTIPLP